MLIQYQGKTFNIESPLVNQGEMLIEVERYALFPGVESNVGQIFQFSHKTKKMLFFLIREGLLATWNKTRTALFQSRIISHRSLVLALGHIRGEDTYVAAVGPADCPASQVLGFPKLCVAEVPINSDPLRIYSMLNEYFEKHPDHREALFYYDSLSGNSIPFSLTEILKPSSLGQTGSRRVNFSFPPANGPSETDYVVPRLGSGYNLFLAGAGVYACISIIPYLKVRRHTIVDKNPVLACAVRERYGFAYADTSCARAFRQLTEVSNPIAVIATYHSTHVPLAELALSLNPDTKVMIEKPPVTTRGQLARLLELRRAGHFIEIGYNRRHTDYVRKARALLGTKRGPTTVTCIIREKTIPTTHWYYWPTQGTRIIGNLTHWIDLGVLLVDSRPVGFNIISSSSRFPSDDSSISVHFEDGSQLNLIATDRGNPLRGIQEYIDIRRDDLTVTIDDFMRFTVQEGGQNRSKVRLIRNKGHKRMYRDFLERCLKNEPAAYPQIDLERTCSLYLSLMEALMRGEKTGEVTL